MRSILTKLGLAVGLVVNLSAAQADELQVGVSQEFENMNPLIMTMSATTWMYYLTGRALTTLDPSGKMIPMLAKEIPTMENGQAKFLGEGEERKIQATWVIQDKAKWGDGTDLTCADFEFARQVGTHAKVGVGNRETWSSVESIRWEEDSPRTCVFTYAEAKWNFNHMHSFYPLPKHIEETPFKKFGDQAEGYEQNSNFVRNPTNPGLYSGPYLVSEVRLGSHVSFERNPHFWGQEPKISKITVKLIPNTGTLEANLRSGTINKISSLGMSFDQALAFDQRVKSEGLPYRVLFEPSITYEHIDLNLDNPILQDLRVRQALVLGINRQELVDSLFEGRQEVAYHGFAPIDPWFTNDPNQITIYPYSRRRANRLLDQAGWKRGADGIREKDGERLSLTFMTTSGNRVRELVQVFLQNQWREIGVEINIRNEPARVFFGETTRRRAFDGLAMYAWVSSPENNPRSTLHSNSIPTAENGWSGQNAPGWRNPKVDAAIEAIDLEFNHDKRVKLAREIQKHYTADVPVIPLYFRSNVAVVPTNLKNYRLSGHLFHETNEAETWELSSTKLQ